MTNSLVGFMRYSKNFIMVKNKKLITHEGSFHADDIFACATLILVLEKKEEGFEIIRTRDEEIIKTGDYVFDVGGVYDPLINYFDHHQTGGAGKHDNGIEYASFGLVWKKFGVDLTLSKESAKLIEDRLVSPVDAGDNGFDLVENKHEVSPYVVQNLFGSMRPTWREGEKNMDKMFLKSVEIAKEIILREIIQAQDMLLVKDSIIAIYNETKDKRIIVLDKNYPFDFILHSFPEPLFVVYPRTVNNTWGIKTVRTDLNVFKNRKDFPQAWGGLKNEELQKITGVLDALFCHRGLFLVVTLSKDGAIKLAEIAVKSS